MASIPINNLTNKTDINGLELLPFVRDGKTYRCSISSLFFNDAVTESVINNNAITTLKLTNSAVTTDKINNNAVTTDKINDNAITTLKLTNSAVTTDKINDNAITTLKLTNSAVTTDKINDNAITTLKLTNSAVTTDKVNNGAITPIKLSIGSPTWTTAGVVSVFDSLTATNNLSARYVILNSTPTASNHATTKEYVDTIINGVSKFPEKSNSGMYCSWDSFCFIDSFNNARVIGNANFKFSDTNIYAPAQIVGSANALYNVSKFYVNDTNSFILTNEGNVFATGYNAQGQLGNGTTTNTSTFKQSTISNCLKIAITSDTDPKTTYFLTNDGKVYSTGDNQYGQLGRGNTTDTSTPILTLGPGNTYGNTTMTVTDIQNVGSWNGSNTLHTAIALLSDGTVRCVGYGDLGQMGDGTSVPTNNLWKQVKTSLTTNLTGITKIYGGGYDQYTTFFALDVNETLYGWGYNGWGQLATGSTADRSYATTISTNVSDFWVFGGSCFLKKSTDNKIYAWGYNNYGALGLGNTVDRTAVTLVSVLSTYNIEKLWGSSFDGYPGGHVFAKETGSNKIFATGYNAQGALGIGNQTQQTQFIQVYFPITSPIIDMICQYDSTAGGYTVILTEDGNAYHCGIARYGLGSPSTLERWLLGKVTNNICG